jgi:hypothetical protein
LVVSLQYNMPNFFTLHHLIRAKKLPILQAQQRPSEHKNVGEIGP